MTAVVGCLRRHRCWYLKNVLQPDKNEVDSDGNRYVMFDASTYVPGTLVQHYDNSSGIESIGIIVAVSAAQGHERRALQGGRSSGYYANLDRHQQRCGDSPETLTNLVAVVLWAIAPLYVEENLDQI